MYSAWWCHFAFSSFTVYWLGVRMSIRPAKNWVMGYWHDYLSGVWCKWCIWSSWCHCHPSVSCFSKIQIGLPFSCRLTQLGLSWKKGRVCVCVLCVYWRRISLKSDVVCQSYGNMYRGTVFSWTRCIYLSEDTVISRQTNSEFWPLLNIHMLSAFSMS